MKNKLEEIADATQNEGKFSHIVLYKANPKNPNAVKRIIENADKYLEKTQGLVAYHCAKLINDDLYNVMLNMNFMNKESYNVYMKDPEHMKFVDFILNGFMLEGTQKTTPKERKQELIDYIFGGSNDAQRKRIRDPKVDESKVVWAGEAIYDALRE